MNIPNGVEGERTENHVESRVVEVARFNSDIHRLEGGDKINAAETGVYSTVFELSE